MSNEAPERSALDAMADRRLPGGCDDCAAYQMVNKASEGVYLLEIRHDQTCPYYRGEIR